jgi:hypothetical protein
VKNEKRKVESGKWKVESEKRKVKSITTPAPPLKGGEFLGDFFWLFFGPFRAETLHATSVHIYGI